MMDTKRVFEGTKKLVLQKMGNGNSCTITHKSGKEFIIAKDYEGWTLYEGCDLIIGDCTFEQCVAVMVAVCA